MSKVVAPDVEPAPAEEKKPAPRPRGKYIDFVPRKKVKKTAEAPKVTVVVAPAVEEYDEGPMAEFNGFDDDEDINEEAQEDFISSDTDDNYVEEVLSKVSETRTETTIRRSPFLKNYHVEKRPLSTRIPVRENVASVEALEPTPRKEFKEEEFIRHADKVPENAETPVETKEEKAGSKFGMALTVVITVLLGAGVGVFVYLAFFK